MSALTLYDYWRSSAAYRVRIGFNLKGVAYDASPVNILPGKDEQRRDAYRAINLQARVPALKTGEGVLTQSLAILEWLDETHPQPPFLIGDAFQRAQIRAFALTIACDVHPLNNLSVLGQLKTQFGADEAAIAVWYRHWIDLGFCALETQLAQRADTPFAFGPVPTLADICLVPQMMNARRFDVDMKPYPLLSGFDERLRAHPAFAKAAPENQKGAS